MSGPQYNPPDSSPPNTQINPPGSPPPNTQINPPGSPPPGSQPFQPQYDPPQGPPPTNLYNNPPQGPPPTNLYNNPPQGVPQYGPPSTEHQYNTGQHSQPPPQVTVIPPVTTTTYMAGPPGTVDTSIPPEMRSFTQITSIEQIWRMPIFYESRPTWKLWLGLIFFLYYSSYFIIPLTTYLSLASAAAPTTTSSYYGNYGKHGNYDCSTYENIPSCSSYTYTCYSYSSSTGCKLYSCSDYYSSSYDYCSRNPSTTTTTTTCPTYVPSCNLYSYTCYITDAYTGCKNYYCSDDNYSFYDYCSRNPSTTTTTFTCPTYAPSCSLYKYTCYITGAYTGCKSYYCSDYAYSFYDSCSVN